MTLALDPPEELAAEANTTKSSARQVLRDGGALGLSVGLVGLFGFLTWSLTARLADLALVGTASTLINAVILAATIGQLQLGTVLLRWLPEAGRHRGTLLRRVYLAILLTCGPAAAIVLVFLPKGIVTGVPEMAAFVAATVVWALFSVQDQMLAGIWRASWVPLENGVFVVVRIALVAPLLAWGHFGMLAAWMLPAGALVLAVAALLPRLLRRARAFDTAAGALPGRAEVVPFIAGSWTASLAALLVTNGLPVVVTSVAGAATGGVFFVVWSIAVSVELGATGFVHALVVRAGGDLDRLAGLVRTVGRWMAVAFLPALAALALLAKPVLGIFGAAYAEHGAVALQLLCAGLAFRLVTMIAIGVAQVHKHPGVIFALQALHCGLLFGALGVVLAGSEGAPSLSLIALLYLGAAAVTAAASAGYLARARVRPLLRRMPLSAVLGGVSLICWLAGARLTRAADAGLLGLVDALHPLCWLGLALLAGALLAELRRSPVRAWRGYLLTLLLVIETYALQPLVESEGRLPVAWLHAGFSDYIAAHGDVLHSFDARFSWPGFFGLAAMVTKAAGLQSATSLIRWAPVVTIIGWTLPMALIGRALRLPPRTIWAAVWIFLAANWAEQEYFSPQGLAYLLFLSCVAMATRVLCRRLTKDDDPGVRLNDRQLDAHRPAVRAAVVAVLVIVMAALAPSHQLTPYLLAGVLFLLALLAGLRPRGLVVVAVALPVTWLVLGAQEFWIGHLGMLTQDVGAVGDVVRNNLVQRLAGVRERALMQAIRLGLVGATVLLAGLGALRLRRGPWRRTSLLVAVLAVSPASFVLVQSYGGEMFLRVWLFALPWLAILAACAILPPAAAVTGARWRPAIAVAVTLLLTATGLVARSGNDGFTRMTAHQVAVLKQFYAQAPAGTRLTVLSSYLPWRFERIEDITYTPVLESCRDTEAVTQCVIDSRPDVVIITPQQEVNGRLIPGYPAGWTGTVVDQLLATGRFTLARKDADITVLERHTPTVAVLGAGAAAWPALAAGTLEKAGTPVRMIGDAAEQADIVLIGDGVGIGSTPRPPVAELSATVARVRAAGATPILVTGGPGAGFDPGIPVLDARAALAGAASDQAVADLVSLEIATQTRSAATSPVGSLHVVTASLPPQ